MPKAGIFARVIAGGKICCDDNVEPVLPNPIKNC